MAAAGAPAEFELVRATASGDSDGWRQSDWPSVSGHWAGWRQRIDDRFGEFGRRDTERVAGFFEAGLPSPERAGGPQPLVAVLVSPESPPTSCWPSVGSIDEFEAAKSGLKLVDWPDYNPARL